MRFVKIPAIFLTVPNLSCVLTRKRHRETRGKNKKMSIVERLADYDISVCA